MTSNKTSETMLYNAAMGLAIAEEMRVNSEIFVLGQGVASGGWFGSEKGLADEFGKQRVVDCGISEAFEVGMAAGASIAGMTPVINVSFADFSLIAGDEIYHKLGKWRYMHGINVPMSAVIILPLGVMGGAGPEHSNSIEVLGMHFPGLKVVVPSNPADAKGLMKAALREPNPVLYHSIQSLSFTNGEVPLATDFVVEIGKGVVRREGRDVTLLTYGSMVNRSLEAAAALQSEDISVEVIDLRSLNPIDWPLILDSVASTHRAMVVHEANRTAGPGAEIAAQIQERAFYELETPVLRVAGKDVPLPQSVELEQACIPSVAEIAEAARHIMNL